MIGPGSDIADCELPFVVRPGSAGERELYECGIFQVVVQADRDAGHRFKVLGIQQNPRYFKRVDYFSGRESEREVFEHVFLIIVGDGIGEVDRIGRVGFQAVFKFDNGFLSGCADDRQLQLGRCDNHILRRFLDLD